MKRKKLADIKILGILIPVLLVAIWQLTGMLGKLNEAIIPTPKRLYEVFIEVIQNGALLKHTLKSLRRVFFGYLVGASCGVTLGIALGLSPLVKRLFSVILELLRPVPILAWVPVLILFAGIGEQSKIIAIAIGSFWSILLNTTDGVMNVDIKYKEVAQIFSKTRLDTIFQVVLPAALPSIFTGLRIGVGSAWLSVIGSEMIASSAGLGYYISYNREMMKPAHMYVGVVTIGVIGWLINILIRRIEKRALRWNRRG